MSVKVRTSEKVPAWDGLKLKLMEQEELVGTELH